mmetsp:Transcript_26604/g.49703  ORF Transcript_26604/g.49703 Transcript_26604/m.49703 type:complete len:347 (-) Transcript_26604:260-1300(-)
MRLWDYICASLLFAEEFERGLSHLLGVLNKVSLGSRRHNHGHPLVCEEAQVLLEDLLLFRPDAHRGGHRRPGPVRSRRVLPHGIGVRSSHEERTLAPALALRGKLPIDLDGLRRDVGRVLVHVAQHRPLNRSLAALRGVHGGAQRGGKLISGGDASAQGVHQRRHDRIILLLHLDRRQRASVGWIDEEHRPDVRRGFLDSIERVERRVARADDVDARAELSLEVREELLQEPTEQARLVGIELRQRAVVKPVAREFGEDGGGRGAHGVGQVSEGCPRRDERGCGEKEGRGGSFGAARIVPPGKDVVGDLQGAAVDVASEGLPLTCADPRGLQLLVVDVGRDSGRCF